MAHRKSTLVGGLGNPLMSDEGIGLHILRNLMARSSEHDDIEFVDLGTSMMGVVHAVAGRKKAILIDCARMKQSPGVMRRFIPEEVTSTKKLPHFSLHEGDLLKALELSQRIGEYPRSVVIYAVEPERIEPGDGLSPLLNSRLDRYVETISRELKVETYA